MWVYRTLLILGLLGSAVSMYQTLAFSWNPAFEAPALAEGPRHTNYHAFRGFTLAVGAAGVMAFGMFQPAAGRRRPLWWAMLIAGGCYYAGWWLPWPLLGLRTPPGIAEIVHVLSASLALGAVILSRRRFPN